MKLKFKKQQFQIDAVNAVADCFAGQPNEEAFFALGGKRQISLLEKGFRNRPIDLCPQDVLANINVVQRRNGLKPSAGLAGEYNLTVEMETGTGKTYVYIKTMFELFQRYGWNKYIVVVPSIPIREGVRKAFKITEDHFMEQYGRKARYFIYNSRYLSDIDQFARDFGINVMIINIQAFNARGKDARRIYMELDDFQSRKPIDIIARTNPIVVIDEPQSVEGKKTRESLKLFKPLFTLRYSATHREDYNKVYRLDAMDAYNKQLVKKISVKGITVKGTRATDGYLFLEGIDISSRHSPRARLEFEKKFSTGLRREMRRILVGDNLYELSGYLEQYRGYIVSEISAQERKNRVEFANGVTLYPGDALGDVNEMTMRRIQIRETIRSHLEKEKNLYSRGIKVLSLFFIDKVAKYRQYDAKGRQINGVYAQIFEEEYRKAVVDYLQTADHNYATYLLQIDAAKTHNGYFSIDRKGHMMDPKVKARETDSEDVGAYDLIMKDKERLLSFAEPTRFIFSHSALKEGWDNTNIFQICTLKHSDSTMKKRQEVGRGLRLCVDQTGERIDGSIPGIRVHDINVLTVVASESYDTFARELQKQIAETLTDRPRKVNNEFFQGNVLINEKGLRIHIDGGLARKIYQGFVRNYYVDGDDSLTERYYQSAENGKLWLPEELKEHQQALIELLGMIYSETSSPLVQNERNGNVELQINDNFYRKEFQKLWKRINAKSTYTVSFDTGELIRRCIAALDEGLGIADITYQIKDGVLDRIESKEQLQKGGSFSTRDSATGKIPSAATPGIRYDLVAKLQDGTRLTRKTIINILTGIKKATFDQFKKNPEEFITKAARTINMEKAASIIERITYNTTGETYEAEIFRQCNPRGTLGVNALAVDKHIYDYVITESEIEKKFVREMDISGEVSVYAKLPKSFFISTPVGNYSPDWAIAFKEGKVKHTYFIAETKGSMESMGLRDIEKAKIHCAKKHFEKISNNCVRYGVVNSFEKLLEIVR